MIHQRGPPLDRPPRHIGDDIRELIRLGPPLFIGATEGTVAEAWIQSLQRCFGLRPYGSNLKARLAVHQLRGDASNWWHQEEKIGGVNMDTLTWETFLERFRERFLSEHFRQKQIEEFHSLHQRGLTVA